MRIKAIAGKTGNEQGLQVCSVCGNYSEYIPVSSEIESRITIENIATLGQSQCPFCQNDISIRKKNSLQKTWALLITAIIFIIPANIYPITFLLKNNILYPDTILSGILSLIDSDMPGIALIVFVASILVPILKIIALGLIVLAVQFNLKFSAKKQLLIFSFVDWVGRWSILDLFVISIMVAVFDKGNLLSVYPGIAATSFTIVVITTLFAANTFDTRLIFDKQTNVTNNNQQEKN